MLKKLSGLRVDLHRSHMTAVADNPNLVDDTVAARRGLRADDATGISAQYDRHCLPERHAAVALCGKRRGPVAIRS